MRILTIFGHDLFLFTAPSIVRQTIQLIKLRKSLHIFDERK